MLVWGATQHAIMITAFVAAMMVAIEYVNVQSRGLLSAGLGRSRGRQYLLAAALGATPGCLGAYVLVSLFTHRQITLGALVAGMIATSGDEMFVMLARIPAVGLGMTVGLVGVALLVAWATDTLWPGLTTARVDEQDRFDVHGDDGGCRCFAVEQLLPQWRRPSRARLALTGASVVFLVTLLTGLVGPADWNWKRVTFAAIGLFVLFVVTTVPDHFLDDHLWHHVARTHVPRIFLWTLGTLIALAWLDASIDLGALVSANRWFVLAGSTAVGIVPESGPHLIFVNLFADGDLPLSVLVASSIAQDGHAMLPLLAHSRTDFLRVKSINVAAALAVGALLMLLGQ